MAKKRQPCRHYTNVTRISKSLYKNNFNRLNSLLSDYLMDELFVIINKAMKDLNLTDPIDLINNYQLNVIPTRDGFDFKFDKNN